MLILGNPLLIHTTKAGKSIFKNYVLYSIRRITVEAICFQESNFETKANGVIHEMLLATFKR